MTRIRISGIILTLTLAGLIASGCNRPAPDDPRKAADSKAPAPPGPSTQGKPVEKARGTETVKAGAGRALLVGVTNYPDLVQGLSLSGGANDVLLMHGLLREVYHFPPENIVTLSEKEGEKDATRLPTHANIERECRRMAREAKEGEKVVVYLSGHGSLQPEKPDVPNPSSDGMDRIFLPRDVAAWDGGTGEVPHALSGRELGDWLRPIPEKKKGLLWVVVDACHSGEMVRGVNERARQVDMTRGLGIPEKAVEAVRSGPRKRTRAARRRAAARPRFLS